MVSTKLIRGRRCLRFLPSLGRSPQQGRGGLSEQRNSRHRRETRPRGRMLITLLYKTLGLNSRVRIRAERKCEELRREMKSAANVPTKREAHQKGVSTSDDSPCLKKFGIRRDQIHPLAKARRRTRRQIRAAASRTAHATLTVRRPAVFLFRSWIRMSTSQPIARRKSQSFSIENFSI